MPKRLRVVLDTNVFVSSTINPHGLPARLLAAARHQTIALLIAPLLLAEVSEVVRRPRLRARHGLSDSQLSDFFLRVLTTSEVVTPLSPPSPLVAGS